VGVLIGVGVLMGVFVHVGVGVGVLGGLVVGVFVGVGVGVAGVDPLRVNFHIPHIPHDTPAAILLYSHHLTVFAGDQVSRHPYF
jgi:hypothetical protein